MMRSVVLGCLAFLLSCGGGGVPVDSGTGDTGGATVPPQTTAVSVAFVAGARLAAAMSGPLVNDGRLLRRDCLMGTSCPDSTTRGRTEHGVSGGSIVTPPTCAMYSWSGLSATVTLTGCTLEMSGTPISGAITVALSLNPTVFRITFTALRVGTTSFDGTVSLTIGGTDLMPTQTLAADLTYMAAGSSVHFVLTGAQVRVTATGGAVTVDGTAMVTTGSTSATIVMSGLTWSMGQCLPSSGTAVVTIAGTPTTTITFLPTTSADGIVTVQVAPFPATMAMLFMPCA